MKVIQYNYKKGFFRIWILLCVLWSIFILLVTSHDIMNLNSQVEPWMQFSCKEIYSNDISKEFIDCVNNLSEKEYVEKLKEMLFAGLFALFMAPLTAFFIGSLLAFLYERKFYKIVYKCFINYFFKPIWKPINWVTKGFNEPQ